jgi:hypothetical protein
MRLRKKTTDLIAAGEAEIIRSDNGGAIVLGDGAWFERDFSAHEAVRKLAAGWILSPSISLDASSTLGPDILERQDI